MDEIFNNNNSITSTITSISTIHPGSDAALLNRAYYRSLTEDQRLQYDYHHQLPGEPSHQAVVAILSLSVLVFVCSSLVLLATRYTSGGQSGTLVFLRSLLMSDILMALYGVTKMAMLLFLHELRVNFFLPDSFFFTASLASTSSLLSLNLDCFIKLARPFEYAQVEKHTVITFMLLVWNAAFVVGFLPLAGWHEEAYTFRFFSFYPWHFLLFNGLVVFICVVICIACMVSLKKFYLLPDASYPAGYTTRMIEVRKYRHLHQTIVVESAMWLTCYLPFFIYISLTCRQCSLGDYSHSDSTIIYFLPLFLAKSLFSAALQAFRTFHVHSVMNKILTDISNMASPLQRRHHHHNASIDDRDNSVATIAYSNPLSDQSEFPSLHSNSSSERRHNLNDIHGHHHHHHHQPHCPLYRRGLSMEEDRRTSYRTFHNEQDGGAHNFVLNDDNWTIHHRDPTRQQSEFVTSDAGGGEFTDAIPVLAATDAIQLDVADNIMGITNFAFEASIDLNMQHESTKL